MILTVERYRKKVNRMVLAEMRKVCLLAKTSHARTIHWYNMSILQGIRGKNKKNGTQKGYASIVLSGRY